MIRPSHLLLLTLFSLAACGETGTPGISALPPSAAATAVVLAKDPGAASSVIDAKIEGAADTIVIEGRIRSIAKGYVAFTLMDVDVPFCGEQCEEGCKTPWDYCCETSEKITANSLAVEARAADGKPIATAALPNLRLLDLVKVTGKLTKDEHGNHTLLATGIFRVERPELPGGLRWPQ